MNAESARVGQPEWAVDEGVRWVPSLLPRYRPRTSVRAGLVSTACPICYSSTGRAAPRRGPRHPPCRSCSPSDQRLGPSPASMSMPEFTATTYARLFNLLDGFYGGGSGIRTHG